MSDWIKAVIISGAYFFAVYLLVTLPRYRRRLMDNIARVRITEINLKLVQLHSELETWQSVSLQDVSEPYWRGFSTMNIEYELEIQIYKLSEQKKQLEKRLNHAP